MKTKKELKEEYKQTRPAMGVFQVVNEVNGKVLLEATTNMQSKWNRHQTELRFGSHRNKQLQKDWNDLGAENFRFSVVSELKFEEGDNLDWNREVKLLKEMVEEELGIQAELKY